MFVRCRLLATNYGGNPEDQYAYDQRVQLCATCSPSAKQRRWLWISTTKTSKRSKASSCHDQTTQQNTCIPVFVLQMVNNRGLREIVVLFVFRWSPIKQRLIRTMLKVNTKVNTISSLVLNPNKIPTPHMSFNNFLPLTI